MQPKPLSLSCCIYVATQPMSHGRGRLTRNACGLAHILFRFSYVNIKPLQCDVACNQHVPETVHPT